MMTETQLALQWLESLPASFAASHNQSACQGPAMANASLADCDGATMYQFLNI